MEQFRHVERQASVTPRRIEADCLGLRMEGRIDPNKASWNARLQNPLGSGIVSRSNCRDYHQMHSS